jgi:hypothetical protein
MSFAPSTEDFRLDEQLKDEPGELKLDVRLRSVNHGMSDGVQE